MNPFTGTIDRKGYIIWNVGFTVIYYILLLALKSAPVVIVLSIIALPLGILLTVRRLQNAGLNMLLLLILLVPFVNFALLIALFFIPPKSVVAPGQQMPGTMPGAGPGTGNPAAPVNGVMPQAQAPVQPQMPQGPQQTVSVSPQSPVITPSATAAPAPAPTQPQAPAVPAAQPTNPPSNDQNVPPVPPSPGPAA